MNVFFLGGVFGERDKDVVLRHSRGVVQMAADTLQKNYLRGFSEAQVVKRLTVVNLPFIGAYPQRYDKMFFEPAVEVETLGRAEVRTQGFFNLSLVKNLHRAYLAGKVLLQQLRAVPQGDNYVVCYSMHLPFLLACQVVKWLRPGTHLCIIVPDLPEYMAVRTGIVKLLFQAMAKVSYAIVGRADSVVAITQPMLDKFETPVKVVIEGIVDPLHSAETVGEQAKPYFLYGGTLDRRYGIRNLVDSYLQSGITSHALYICGAGDDQAYVERAAAGCEGIKYLGQVSRAEVLKLQREASLLVNPRGNDSIYTKYSFPSKVIEYMSSGVPILMYRLDGIPEQYYDFCYLASPAAGGMGQALLTIVGLDPAELRQMGQRAKDFVTEHKMPAMQVEKLLNAIKR
ncbi:MAG: glycosyltransferase [Paucimonas sp.]|nr:glycosyltransferase [Paucimonas sp.]